jgi:hypothetical protein
MVSVSRPFARAAALLLLAGVASGAALAQAPPSRIALVLDADGAGRTSRIYVANPDGTAMRPVSPGVGRDRDPAFSPTGQTLAYQTNSQGVEQIAITPVEGGATRVLVDGGAKPQWSRDGQRILFSRRQDNKDRLFIIRADGKQKDQALKPITDGRIGRWSPDEKQLAVATTAIVDKADHWQLRVVSAEAPDTGSRRTVTLPEDWGPVLSLEWSPNGQSLLFSVARGPRNELYVLDPSSPEPRRVPAGDKVPNADYGAWSPDGKEILFRASAEGGSPGMAPVSRLCAMNPDGTNVRVVWEPEVKTARIQGLTWHQPPVQVAAVPPVPMPKPPVVEPPKPMPVTPPPVVPMPPVQKVLGPPVKLHAGKVFRVARDRSPVTVNMAAPGAADFIVTVPVQGSGGYKKQRQGVGITLELEDGSLYRGTVIYSDAPWVTLQGRASGGKVRLIDGRQLDPGLAGFRKGFNLSVRREGQNLIIAVNGQDQLTRPVLSAPIRQLSLTLENFDVPDARVPLGNIYYREWGAQAAEAGK